MNNNLAHIYDNINVYNEGTMNNNLTHIYDENKCQIPRVFVVTESLNISRNLIFYDAVNFLISNFHFPFTLMM